MLMFGNMVDGGFDIKTDKMFTFSDGPYYVRAVSTYQDVWMSFCAVTFKFELKID